MALPKYLTRQQLERGSMDADTLDKFATDPAGTPNINRVGEDVENLNTLRERMLDVAAGAANLQTYLTKSAMQADTGQPIPTRGQVTSDPVGANNGYYDWNGTSWIWSQIQPASAEVVNRLTGLIEQGGAAAIAFTDELGFALGPTVTQDGAYASDFYYLAGSRAERTTGSGVFFTDEAGFVTFSASDARSDLDGKGLPAIGHQIRTQVMHAIVYGQSLSRGSLATPVISTSQPYSNVTLAGGVLARAGDEPYDPSALVPLVERQYVTIEGETPASGLCNGMVRRIVSDGELAADWVFCGSAPGLSGGSIATLSPGGSSGRYEQLLQLIRDTKTLANATGKSYSVWMAYWLQGEADMDRTAGSYTEAQARLFEAFTRDVAEITGQRFAPYVFTYQVAAHRRYSKTRLTVAKAQWQLSRSREQFVLAVPAYIAAVGSDNLHLTAESSWLMGEYASRAAYQTMYKRGAKWRPLEPTEVVWTDQYIDIKFHVPCGTLVLDDALAVLTHNFGFDVFSVEGNLEDIIETVDVQGNETVRLTLSEPASSGARLTYAVGRSTDPLHSGPVSGARGNLRDSHGDFDTVISTSGALHALHNPCVMFEYDRASGF